MKKLLLIGLVGAIFSCSTSKDIYLLTEKEMSESKYFTYKDSIRLKSDSSFVGKINNIEWELFNNKLYPEVSISVDSFISGEDAEDIIKYVHTKQPRVKIELNYDR
jgi:hypothetical protein